MPFMSLSIAKFVTNSHIYPEIYVIFLKNVLKQTWNSFNTKFRLWWKDGKSSYQSTQLLGLLWSLIDLTLDEDSVKGLRVTKIVKEKKLVWGELKSRRDFQRQSFLLYLRLILIFVWNDALRENINFCFSMAFCWYWGDFRFLGGGPGRWASFYGVLIFSLYFAIF